MTLEVLLRSERMRERRERPSLLSRGNFRTMYWTIAQLLAHHASNGCNHRPGDLLASGTVSEPEPLSRGCLLERSRRGAEPVTLPMGKPDRSCTTATRSSFVAIASAKVPAHRLRFVYGVVRSAAACPTPPHSRCEKAR